LTRITFSTPVTPTRERLTLVTGAPDWTSAGEESGVVEGVAIGREA
jgi:hypothetical protein